MTDTIPHCPRCGGPHRIIACPGVKAVNLASDDRITRIEFLVPADLGHGHAAPKQDAGEPEPAYPRKGH